MDHAGLKPGLEVRRARADELAACATLYEQVLRDTFTWSPPGRYRAADFLRAAVEEEVYVAVVAGAILGLASVHASQKFLHSLYVADRARGIGRALLAYVIDQTGGELQLKCQTANTRAQAFYRREGFRSLERGEDGGVAWIRFVYG